MKKSIKSADSISVLMLPVLILILILILLSIGLLQDKIRVAEAEAAAMELVTKCHSTEGFNGAVSINDPWTGDIIVSCY